MIIALDYDQTYTVDTHLWNEFIKQCIDHNHTVICITMRFPNEAIKLMPNEVKIYYTSRKAKLIWAKENNVKVDIWIDDKPGWLFDDAASAA